MLHARTQEHAPPKPAVDLQLPDWSTFSLSELTLTTYHVGSARSLVVLQDWLEFFGVAATQVRMVSATSYPQCFTNDEFCTLFPQSELVDLPTHGQSIAELDSPAVYHAISSSPTAWVALVKLDTLPYRSLDHRDWLTSAAEVAAERGSWGITGFQTHLCKRLSHQFSETQSFSQNFAIVHRDAWCSLFAEYGGELRDRVLSKANSAVDRYGMEATIETGLAKEGWWNLRLVDREELSVFHVNRWGDELLRTRERYRRRDRVRPHFNGEGPLEAPVWTLPPWRRYYGTQRPSLFRRARNWMGQVRRRLDLA